MRLLFLYGINCTKEIWNKITPYFLNYEVDYVEYPHEITAKAKKAEDITNWVYEAYHHNNYDAIIGHSLGGIVALQLVSKYKMDLGRVIFLDTNLKPAEAFYRNLMTPEHLEMYGNAISEMFEQEKNYYSKELYESVQSNFDYTKCLDNISQKVYGIYGDRGIPEYKNKIKDLNLTDEILEKIDLLFINNACHMIMYENPKKLSEVIKDILKK